MKLPRHSRTCPSSVKLSWSLWQSRRLFEIIKNILKLPRHSRTYQTSEKLFWTFWQSRRLLKIIEKYFEASKTFRDLSIFSKVILDLLIIQDTFKNHRKIFLNLQDIPGLIKLQESYVGHLVNPGNF